MLKSIVLYLPQFYRTPQNDEWWGEGFTEWTAVKNAEPICFEHNQPREPLNDNYYNLLDKSTMEWQAELAQKYGINGFCFYHYWFENGKRILEKPAENLLKWTDIEMPFCFSWANESWMRTWGNVRGGNVWSELYGENVQVGNGILLNQSYGDEDAWKEHFEYLLPFFRDRRYITIDEKPVFIVYRPDLIPQYILLKMFLRFRCMAEKAGLPGLYLISANSEEKNDDIFDAYLSQEPKTSLREVMANGLKGEESQGYAYDELWDAILNKYYVESKTYFCGVVDYDETPRKGKNGTYLSGVSPLKFYQYFKKLAEKSVVAGNEFVFLNAWNEWGEGMYLEPDKKNGYTYLEAVKLVMEETNNVILKNPEILKGQEAVANVENILGQKNKRINKFVNYFDVLNVWLSIRQADHSLERYFIEKGYKTIALYGIGVMGKHLYEELKNSNVNIAYAIDKKVSVSFIPVFSLYDMLPKVDAIIVTPTFDFGNIYEQLKKLVCCPIVSLEEVINWVLETISSCEIN